MSTDSVLVPRTVFILDVSQSMSVNSKLSSLVLSAKRYLADIAIGSYAGIVYFSTTARTVQPVVQIVDESVRAILMNSLPKRAESSTDIGAGIIEALAAFKNSGLSTEGASLILVTDGEQTSSDPVFGLNYLAKVLPEVLAAKVRFICVAIGSSADANLEALANATNGTTHCSGPDLRHFTKASGGDVERASMRYRELSSRAMRSAFQQTSHSSESYESMGNDWSSGLSDMDVEYRMSSQTSSSLSETINVCNDLLELSKGLNEIQVIIDSDIGRNTKLIVDSEDIDKFSVSIRSPKGTKSKLFLNFALKSFQLTKDFMESGVWTVRIKSKSEKSVLATLLVSSQPMSCNAIPVRMNVIIKEAETDSPPIIIAKLLKGCDAVIWAEVTATVDRPNGTQSTVKLINYNNIYCNYFTDNCGSGRYNVTVLAKSNDISTRLKNLTVPHPGSGDSQTVEPFQRQQIVGSFKIDGSITFSTPASDQKLQELALNEGFIGPTTNSPVPLPTLRLRPFI